MSDMSDWGPKLTPTQTTFMKWFGIVLLIAMVINWALLVAFNFNYLVAELVPKHFAVFILLPTAGVCSFLVVFVFRQAVGPIQVEGLTFKFKGAAGPVILWILCFLTMVAAIKLVW